MAKLLTGRISSSNDTHEPYRTKLGIEILQHLYCVEVTLSSDFLKKDGRDLTKDEESLKAATINCLRQYMSGEINLGDCAYSGESFEPDKKFTLNEISEKLSK